MGRSHHPSPYRGADNTRSSTNTRMYESIRDSYVDTKDSYFRQDLLSRSFLFFFRSRRGGGNKRSKTSRMKIREPFTFPPYSIIKPTKLEDWRLSFLMGYQENRPLLPHYVSLSPQTRRLLLSIRLTGSPFGTFEGGKVIVIMVDRGDREPQQYSHTTLVSRLS